MKRIVIADDSGTARLLIKKCLEIVGFNESTFIEASNGKEAFDIIKKEPVDLLVTDLSMPIMDGETLLRCIKRNPNLKNIPVIVVTSSNNKAKELYLTSLGAHSVLSKPTTPASLKSVISPLL